jgi:hypothetical protein
MDEPTKQPRSRWTLGRIVLILIPTLVPLVYFYFTGRSLWTLRDLANVGMIVLGYWIAVFLIAARVMRARQSLASIHLASPLIELPLNSDLRARLSRFAAARQQKLAVAAFDLLDRELPRFDPEDERERARRDNEHLRQQAGQGAFLVAVTTEILKRLLLLSGAQEEDRTVWRSHISETAARIVTDALDQRIPATES